MTVLEDVIDFGSLDETFKTRGLSLRTATLPQLTEEQVDAVAEWVSSDVSDPDLLPAFFLDLEIERLTNQVKRSAKHQKRIDDAEAHVRRMEGNVEAVKDDLKEAKESLGFAIKKLREAIVNPPNELLPFPEDDELFDDDSVDPEPAEDVGAKLPLIVLAFKDDEQISNLAKERAVKGLTVKRVESLAEQIEGSTIGDLEKHQRENPFWNADLKGFGEEWITRLQDAHMIVREVYPMPSEADSTDDSNDENAEG